MRKYFFDIVLLSFFTVLVGIFFYPTILYKKLPVPSDSLVGLYHPWRDYYSHNYPRGIPFKNFLITDPIRQQIPWRKIAIDDWKNGQVAIWNPYNFSGAPLAANIQAGVFYSLNIIFFLFDFPVAWTILIILEPLLAGIFLYLYLRNIKLSPIACLFGAVMWSFSGFSIAWLTWGTIVHVALWLPLILLVIDKLFLPSNRSFAYGISWSLIGIFSLVSQLTAGHAQISLYLMLIAFSYLIWQLKKVYGLSKINMKTLFWTVAVFSFFALISSILWLPFLKLVFSSNRLTDFSSWLAEGWFLPWEHLVQFIAPDFFGNPATLNYWGKWNYGEFIGYLGILPLVFMSFALMVKDKRIFFWTMIAGIALLFALPTPLAKIPYLLNLPVISSLQPTRLLFIIDFAMIIVICFGVDIYLNGKNDGLLKRSIFLVFIILAIIWLLVELVPLHNKGGELVTNLAISRRNLVFPSFIFLVGISFLSLSFFNIKIKNVRSIILLTILFLTVFDLFRFGWKFTPFTDESYFFPTTTTINFLQHQTKPFRIMSLDNKIFPPNTASYYGLETIEGYDPIYSGRYEEMVAAWNRRNPDISPPFGFHRIITGNNLNSTMLKLFNVKYVLSLETLNVPILNEVFTEGSTHVYENNDSLPRFFYVNNIKLVKNKQDAITALFDSEFNPDKQAVVEQTKLNQKINSDKLSTGTIKLIKYSDNKITVQTDNAGEGFLVLTTAFDPSWHVRIISKDNNVSDAEILLTDFDFMGIFVPKGQNQIEFYTKLL